MGRIRLLCWLWTSSIVRILETLCYWLCCTPFIDVIHFWSLTFLLAILRLWPASLSYTSIQGTFSEFVQQSSGWGSSFLRLFSFKRTACVYLLHCHFVFSDHFDWSLRSNLHRVFTIVNLSEAFCGIQYRLSWNF